MSPIVLRQGKYEVVIFTRDHYPAHVHVFSADKAAKIKIHPVEVMDSWGFNAREIRQILALVEAHQSLLLAEWRKYHPS